MSISLTILILSFLVVISFTFVIVENSKNKNLFPALICLSLSLLASILASIGVLAGKITTCFTRYNCVEFSIEKDSQAFWLDISSYFIASFVLVVYAIFLLKKGTNKNIT